MNNSDSHQNQKGEVLRRLILIGSISSRMGAYPPFLEGSEINFMRVNVLNESDAPFGQWCADAIEYLIGKGETNQHDGVPYKGEGDVSFNNG